MNSKEIRKKFLEFFRERDHTIVPSSSLIPDDPSVLLTTAGMQQFKKYFIGEFDPMKDFGSLNTASIQKSFRTSDIDEVGDETHLTFFEMLGHFSFGDYFKKETIDWTYELLTKVFQIPTERISATVFEGDPSTSSGQAILFDKESFEAWSTLLPSAQLRKGPRADNVWGPAGVEGPCGACNEVYVDDVEVATLVFMEYYSHADKKLTKLAQKGVDVGWGFERIVTKLQEKKNIFETDLFMSLIEFLPQELPERVKRIITDHARSVAFLATDGIEPSNKGAGYILRRLIRRIFVYMHVHTLRPDTLEELIKIVITNYSEFYPELQKNRDEIIKIMWMEYERFNKTVSLGMKELEKLANIDAVSAFALYESYGLPYEVIKELGGERANTLQRENFDEEFKKHQEISRVGQEKKFGGHGLLLDTGELKAGNEEELKKVLRLHTATHLLQGALREVLGSDVHQAGSDITAERTRFDFSFPRKLTSDEIKKVEEIVNEKIQENVPVQFVELPKSDAEKIGALHFFKEKYSDKVKVYFIGKDIESAWSKEFCGGPHVARTGEIKKFKIAKEEAVGAGVRRIRGIID